MIVLFGKVFIMVFCIIEDFDIFFIIRRFDMLERLFFVIRCCICFISGLIICSFIMKFFIRLVLILSMYDFKFILLVYCVCWIMLFMVLLFVFFLKILNKEYGIEIVIWLLDWDE